MDGLFPDIKIAFIGEKWLSYETFVAACYFRKCVIAEFKAEYSTGLTTLPDELQKEIIKDYTESMAREYTLGWFNGSARSFSIDLKAETSGIRTRLAKQNYDVERKMSDVAYHEQDVKEEEIKIISTMKQYSDSLDEFKPLSQITNLEGRLSNEGLGVIRLSYLRSKYGMYTGVQKTLELLIGQSKVKSYGGNTLQHIGTETKSIESLKPLIKVLCSAGLTVCFGIPGITSSDAVMYDYTIDNAADADAAKIVESSEGCSEGVFVKPPWYWRAAAICVDNGVMYIVFVHFYIKRNR